MAVLDAGEFDKFAFDFAELAILPNDIINNMMTKGGEEIKNAISKTASSMLNGPYSKGVIKSGLTLGTTKRTFDGASIYVTFEGYRGKSRIAEIAFINEFGKQNQPARQFIRTANEESADAVANAMLDIMDDYFSGNGF